MVRGLAIAPPARAPALSRRARGPPTIRAKRPEKSRRARSPIRGQRRPEARGARVPGGHPRRQPLSPLSATDSEDRRLNAEPLGEWRAALREQLPLRLGPTARGDQRLRPY